MDLITGPVRKIKLNYFYYAGQKQEFNYEGITYTLYSTGSKRDGKICNFKLFLMANVKGHTFNQLLKSLGNNVILDGGENETSIGLTFVGDIDGDKIPDLIIEEWGYPFESTSLYLSKPAGNKAIEKLVAYFYTSD